MTRLPPRAMPSKVTTNSIRQGRWPELALASPISYRMCHEYASSLHASHRVVCPHDRAGVARGAGSVWANRHEFDHPGRRSHCLGCGISCPVCDFHVDHERRRQAEGALVVHGVAAAVGSRLDGPGLAAVRLAVASNPDRDCPLDRLCARQDESLLQQGIRATGVVLAVLQPRMNVVINNVYIRRQVRLRIEREDGAPAYEGMLKGLFMLGEIPSVGDKIPLLVDRTKPQRFEYAKKEETPAPPTLARPTAASATGRANIGDQLEKLADLHERGAITDSEFDAAKKKLLRN